MRPLRARRGLIVGAGLAAIMVTVAPAAGATGTGTFTWTGAGSNARWSTAANWEGDIAPVEGETANLDFPAVACSPECAATTDDLPALSVGLLTIVDKVVASTDEGPGSPPPRGASSYAITGTQPLDLADGLNVTASITGSGTGISSSSTQVAVPIVLAADNRWSLEPDVNLAMTKNVTGPFPITIGLDGAGLQLEASDETGPLTISGPGSLAFGTPSGEGDLNGEDGEPVDLSDVMLLGHGSVGPLTFEGGYLYVGFPGDGGDLRVNGSMTLGAGSNVEIDSPGLDGSPAEIVAKGSIDLDSATLRLGEGCATPGTVLTLVEAQGGISGVFENPAGEPITDGETIQPGASECPGSTSAASPLRIEYSPTAVTATVLASSASPHTNSEGGQRQPQQKLALTAPNTTIVVAAIVAALDRGIAPAEATTIEKILRHDGLLVPFTAPLAGTARIDWYATPTPARAYSSRTRARRTPIQVAAGQMTFTGPKTADLYVKLTNRGKILLRHHGRLRITTIGVFTTPRQAPVSVTAAFTLKS